MRILVTGGTGLVGRRLLPGLRERGHEVLMLSRQAKPKLPDGCVPLIGDPSVAGPWLDQLDECDGVVHLAGENVFARRWWPRFKRRLHDSRILSTQLIAERLAHHPRRADGLPKLLVTASAVGYYGLQDNEELDEESPPGNDFLARLCVDWEKATQPASTAGVRVTQLRFGMVLDREGGALPKMARPFRWFLGGYMGDGKQWISWIHAGDLVKLLLFALERSDVNGPVNACSPEPLTNWGFSKMLGQVLHRPCWLRAPAWVLRIMLGEVATVITGGQRVIPRRALKLGYEFQYADLDAALRDLCGFKRDGASG